MYRFLRSPRWVVGHVLVAIVVVLFVNLGLWQLRRLDERRDFNATVEARLAEPVAELDEILDPSGVGPGDALWRRVEATGHWVPEQQVLVRNRSLEGRPGYHVLNPLVLEDADAAVYVNRGWVPREPGAEVASTGPALPRGEVTVRGLLRPGEEKGRFGPSDPDEGVLHEMNRADLDRLQRQSEWDLYPVVLVLEAQRPPVEGDLPVVLPPPELTERNHLSYAVQWFSFTVIVLVGWPLVIRRHARTQHSESSLSPLSPAAR